jgi:hypothetical protein
VESHPGESLGRAQSFACSPGCSKGRPHALKTSSSGSVGTLNCPGHSPLVLVTVPDTWHQAPDLVYNLVIDMHSERENQCLLLCSWGTPYGIHKPATTPATCVHLGVSWGLIAHLGCHVPRVLVTGPVESVAASSHFGDQSQNPT